MAQQDTGLILNWIFLQLDIIPNSNALSKYPLDNAELFTRLMPTAAVHWNVTAIENHAGRWLQRCRMQLFSCRHISDKLL